MRESAEALITHERFRRPLELSLRSNLFILLGILMEASLAYRLSDDSRYLELVRSMVADVGDRLERRKRLSSESHLAFAVIGLAVAAELCGDGLGGTNLQRTVGDITAELHSSARRQPWGDDVPRRNAWNHTAVCFAAIACGGLITSEAHPDAQAWREIGLHRVRKFFAEGITADGMTREGLAYAASAFASRPDR